MKKNKVLEICVDTHCSLVEALRQVNAQLAEKIKELCYTLNMNYTHVGGSALGTARCRFISARLAAGRVCFSYEVYGDRD